MIFSDLLLCEVLLGVEVFDAWSLLELVTTQYDLLDRIFSGIAFCTDELIHPAIWSGSHDIMLDEDGLSVLGADQSGGLVSVLEVLALPSVTSLDVAGAVYSLGFHCYKGLEAVSPVNVQYLGNRA